MERPIGRVSSRAAPRVRASCAARATAPRPAAPAAASGERASPRAPWKCTVYAPSVAAPQTAAACAALAGAPAAPSTALAGAPAAPSPRPRSSRAPRLAARAAPRRRAATSSDTWDASDEDDDGARGAEAGELPPDMLDIYQEKLDIRLKEVASMYADGELDLCPEFQRGLVWDSKMASGLIVTALKGGLIPTVYLWEHAKERYTVLDGKQRLASLLSFYRGDDLGLNWPHAPTSLTIESRQYDTRWSGWTFKRLPEDRQRAFERYSLRVITVKTPADSLVDICEVYRDLNVGGVGHHFHQLREVMFQSDMVRLLKRLESDDRFQRILGKEVGKQVDDPQDRELIARFLAMREARRESKGVDVLEKFLDRFLERNKSPPREVLAEAEAGFKDAMDVAVQVWGAGTAFRQKDSRFSAGNKIMMGLWDTVGPGIADFLSEAGKASGARARTKKALVKNAEALRLGLSQLYQDPQWVKDLKSTKRAPLMRRASKFRSLLDSVASPPPGPRAFGKDLRRSLFDSDPTCQICGGQIIDVEDAEVDHILPWTAGGATSEDNAQLAHRTCNRSKSASVAPGASDVTVSTAAASAAAAAAADAAAAEAEAEAASPSAVPAAAAAAAPAVVAAALAESSPASTGGAMGPAAAARAGASEGAAEPADAAAADIMPAAEPPVAAAGEAPQPDEAPPGTAAAVGQEVGTASVSTEQQVGGAAPGSPAP